MTNPSQGTKPSSQLLIIGLILFGVLTRLMPHPPNATPVMAIALFGGTLLTKRWAIALPLTIIAISDVLIGWHNTVAFTWGAFLLTGTLAWWIRRRPSAWRIFTGALAGSVIFFLVTNFGVWAVGELYPRTAAGFWQCYLAAIPFFRNTVIGNLVYTGAFFGIHALIKGSDFVPHRAQPSAS